MQLPPLGTAMVLPVNMPRPVIITSTAEGRVNGWQQTHRGTRVSTGQDMAAPESQSVLLLMLGMSQFVSINGPA